MTDFETMYPSGAFAPAPVWRRDRKYIPVLTFATYSGALAIVNQLRGEGILCVIRQGQTVYRDEEDLVPLGSPA